MPKSYLKDYIGKLTIPTRRALEEATHLCVAYGHSSVEIAHWLEALLKQASIKKWLQHHQVNVASLTTDIHNALNVLPRQPIKTPSLAGDLVAWLEKAWLTVSLDYHATEIHGGYLFITLLTDEALQATAAELSPQLTQLNLTSLQQDMITWFGDSTPSVSLPTNTPVDATASNDALNRYTVDLIAQAKKGEIDTIVGRENEVRQIIDILIRRRQNNAILTGEAGVGKTAVVEAFALRLLNKQVPQQLHGISLRALDLTLLQAGASLKGEFEQRVKSVIEAVEKSPQPIILFIDEAHTMIGAGGAEGQGDVANILKPALARGTLRTIAATTWSEYKKYFEKDAALTRRFQVVNVPEPDEKSAIEMMRVTAKHLEKHHQVRILDEAVIAAVKLSQRYIADRKLPDKAVSLLDTACARVVLSRQGTPIAIEIITYQIEQLTNEIAVLRDEQIIGFNHHKTIAALEKQQRQHEKKLTGLKKHWEKEQVIIERIHALHKTLPTIDDSKETSKLRQQLTRLKAQLKKIQGQQPLVALCVDAQVIAEIVERWTGIPTGKILQDEVNNLLKIKTGLTKRVIGQDHALTEIAQQLQIGRAHLGDPRKPMGIFLLAGTSGTGKTETALALADLFYGGEQQLITINMSEFKEEHKVSTLIGSPPGYVGYGEGGTLTNAVRRRPYSVILLDEMEKAHHSVQEIFYQVFDKGILMDGEGREVDFKNTTIIMTTNAGTQTLMHLYREQQLPDDAIITDLTEKIRPELLKSFKPAFLGRLSIIPYLPLADDVVKQIAQLQLVGVAGRLFKNYRAQFHYSPAVLDKMAAACHQADIGARHLEQIIQTELLPPLAVECLTRLGNSQTVNSVEVDVGDQGNFNFSVQ